MNNLITITFDFKKIRIFKNLFIIILTSDIKRKWIWVSENENKGIAISLFTSSITFPRDISIASKYISSIRFNNCESGSSIITMNMKFACFKSMFASSKKQSRSNLTKFFNKIKSKKLCKKFVF